MIINVRSTSGSGKSTLVRKVMERYRTSIPVYAQNFPLLFDDIKDRKRPLGYMLHRGETSTSRDGSLFVPGHYETACGGCDTIAKNQFLNVYKLVRMFHSDGYDVLYEGLLLSAESARAIQLHKDGLPFVCVGLTTPLDVCLDSIKARRLAKGKPDEPFADTVLKNATSKQKGAESCLRKMEAAGCRVFRGDRDAALAFVLAELGL